jgi:hypothetical protein
MMKVIIKYQLEKDQQENSKSTSNKMGLLLIFITLNMRIQQGYLGITQVGASCSPLQDSST